MDNAIGLLEEVALKMELCGESSCSSSELMLLSASLKGAIEGLQQTNIFQWPVVGRDVYVGAGQPVATDLHFECLRQSLALANLSDALGQR